MQLMHLNQMSCPHCGAPCVREEIGDTHSNGAQHEWQAMKCGFRHHYIPNYLRAEVETRCPNEPAVVAQRKHRELLKTALDEVLVASTADAEFKRRVKTYGWEFA